MEIYRLLKWNNLSIIKAIHIGQKLPREAKDIFYQFFHDIIKVCRELNIYKGEEKRIINCDQIPIYLEMYDICTLDIKRHKEVIINTLDNEKKEYQSY